VEVKAGFSPFFNGNENVDETPPSFAGLVLSCTGGLRAASRKERTLLVLFVWTFFPFEWVGNFLPLFVDFFVFFFVIPPPQRRVLRQSMHNVSFFLLTVVV